MDKVKTSICILVPKAILPLVIFLFFCSTFSIAQFREIYKGTDAENNIDGIFFTSPSTGFAAFDKFIGYTNDSGHTFIHRAINMNNIDPNGFYPNLTFGFSPRGVYAFSKDSLLVYGDFFAEPSILFSANQGQTWKIVYHKSLNPNIPLDQQSVTDIAFPDNGNSGFAVLPDGIIKTTNKGQTWVKVFGVGEDQNLKKLSFPSSNVGYVIGSKSLYKTIDGGAFWFTSEVFAYGSSSSDNSVYFLNNSIGYVSINKEGKIYKTTTGGTIWTQMNDESINPVGGHELYFTNDSTGFICTGSIWKTTDNGKTWEICKRNVDYPDPGYRINDLFFYKNQYIWAGGSSEYLLLSTDGGNHTIPKALFKVDTTNLTTTGIVKLNNFSKKSYQYKWYVNDKLIGSTYDITYNHTKGLQQDTISLIVFNGTDADTLVHYQNFNGPDLTPIITSFTPVAAEMGTTVIIHGKFFTGTSEVSFGEVPATSFVVISDSLISAIVGNGKSGAIHIATSKGTAYKTGFAILPTIKSFSPIEGASGDTLLVKGANLRDVVYVTLGGYTATFKIISDSIIKVEVGSGATGELVLRSDAGTTSKPGFVYIQPPTISSFTPSIGGRGTTITITGSNFNDVLSVYVGGSKAISFTIVSPTTIQAIVGDGSSGSIDVMTRGGKTISMELFKFVNTPVISYFVPASGTVGSMITITGANFSTIADNNYVFFGGVRATVLSASSNILHVSVPAGARYEPITVTVKYLTTISAKPFIPTFSNSTPFSSSSFAGRINFAAGLNPADIKSGDIDGDSKPDIIVMNAGSKSLSIYKNTSTREQLSFAEKIDLPTGSKPNHITISDINGDGKLDIIYTSLDPINGFTETDDALSIFENSSTSGNISFKPRKSFKTLHNPNTIAVGDLNGDGKIDIAVANQGQESFSVFSNASVNGNVAFHQRQDFPAGNTWSDNVYISDIVIADFNGDLKPDIAVGNEFGVFFSVFENESLSPDVPNFINSRIDFGVAGGSSMGLTLADFNLDGKPDLLGRHGVFKNTSWRVPILDFSIQRIIDFGGVVAIGDINGDGKPDFVRSRYLTASAYPPDSVSVLLNMSAGNNISFAPQVDFQTGDYPSSIWVGDLDGDGMPEIATTNYNERNFSILRNQINGITLLACQGSSKNIASQKKGIKYQWQENSGSGFTDIGINSYFQGVQTDTLRVINVPGSINGHQFRCVVDGQAGIPYTLTIKSNEPIAISITATADSICSGSAITFNAITSNGVLSPFYQWQVNSNNIGADSPIFSTTALRDLDEVRVILTDSAACATVRSVVSNIIRMTVVTGGKIIGKASAPVKSCAGIPFTISYTSSNTPSGSQVQIWESINGSAFISGGIQLFNGSILDYQVTSNNTLGNRKYFFSITPPATNTCFSPTNSDTIDIQVKQLEVPIVILNNQTFKIANPDADALYSWQVFNSGIWKDLVPATTGISYKATVSGSYRAKATKDGCLQFSDSLMLDGLGILPSNGGNEFGIYLYPNPSTGILNIDSLKLSDDWTTLDIMSIDGSRRFATINIENKTKITVHLESLRSGVYMAVFTNRRNSINTIKFVKF